MISLQESLLDDFETISRKSDSDIYLNKLHKQADSMDYRDCAKKGLDALGRSLKVGDIVLISSSHGAIEFGKIMDIDNSNEISSKASYVNIAVSQTGDSSYITILGGPDKGKLSYNYASTDLIKIDDKVLKLIYNIK